MKKILSIMLAAATLTACNIERLPYGSLAAEQITQDPSSSLDALMNGVYAQLKTWSDPMHRLGEYSGDNMMIRGSSTDAFYEFLSFSRTPNNYRLQNFWDYGYKAIAQASNIISMIPEGQSAEIDNQIGECYYIRGMMYFYMVRAFGRPYYQAPDKNLGVPIVNGTPDNILDMAFDDRATVQKSYEQAINDLKKAEQLMTIWKGPAFASKEAAQAMLSRVYLYMSGTYEKPNVEYAEKCVEYSNKVLESPNLGFVSRDQLMHYNEIVPENNPEAIFVVKRVASEFSGYDHYYGVGGMYANIGGMGWGEMFASAKYIDLLNETGRNDWRPDSYKIVDARAAFIEPQYVEGNELVFRFIQKDDLASSPTGYQLNYAQFAVKRNGSEVTCEEPVTVDGATTTKTYKLTPVDAEQEIYSINYEGETFTGVLDYRINLNRVYPEFYIVKCSREGEDSHLHSPVISRVAEIYLNRAEAYAKWGKLDLAVADLDKVRGRAIIGGEYGVLRDMADASEKIDKERTLELAYQAERSYDVFRNGKPLVRHYPGPHVQFEDIPATDYRVTYYIPQNAINAYPGTLTQNPTSNAGVVMN